MTRGQMVLIKNNKIYTSLEFNGDMYPEYYGIEVIKLLLTVKTLDDFTNCVYKFNEETFEYADEKLIYEYDYEYIKDFNPYFEKWFSDYLYILNLNDEDIECTPRSENKKEKLILKNNTITPLNFGMQIDSPKINFLHDNLGEFINRLNIDCIIKK